MDTIKEELDVYKTVASMTGDIVYRYDVAADAMELIFGRADMSKYGSTVNNYVQMLYRQQSSGLGQGINVDDFIQGLKSPDRGYFECKAHISNHNSNMKWYSIIGKTVYDDYNRPKYIVGKMTELEENMPSVHNADSDDDNYDRLTGMMTEAGIRKKLDEKCGELSGGEAAFIKLKVEAPETDDARVNSDNVVISVAQCFKRMFPYNAYTGRSEQNEFYVLYYGDDIYDSLISRLDMLKYTICNVVSQTGISAIVNCGVYMGPFNRGGAHDIKEKAHVAFLKSKYQHPNSITTYSGELEKEFNTSYRNLENVEFDNKLVESALEIMSENGDIEKAINLIFDEVGRKYNLDRIVVHELDFNTRTVKTTYNWINQDYSYLTGIVLREPPIDYAILEKVCQQKEIIIASDVRNMDDDEFGTCIKSTEIKSFVHCVFTGSHHISGCIGFECYDGIHEWSDTEIKTFKLISQLVSSFLLNMREYEELIFVNESYETHDALTGLYKNDAFKKEADKYIKYDKSNELAVIYTGMKGFSYINPRFGYDVGDRMLKGYAKAISDDERFIMGCRINADNVVALVKVFDGRGNRISASAINRINNVFSAEYEHVCPGLDVSITAGMSIVTDRSKPLDYYIDRAFEARGRAINSGLDGILVD